MKDKILKKILINPNTGCWIWQGFIDPDGYARSEIRGGKNKFVHRISYEAFIGKIDKGMSIDHICRNRKCCNPQHLQTLSIKDNLFSGNSISAINKRKTHCKRGHEFNEENTYIIRKSRVCKECAKIGMIKYKNNKIFGIKSNHHKNYSPIERVLNNLIEDTNGCLIWSGQVDENGIGVITVDGKYSTPQRIIYKEYKGEIPYGFSIYRKCGNKLCCALKHLFIEKNGTVNNKITLVKSGG